MISEYLWKLRGLGRLKPLRVLVKNTFALRYRDGRTAKIRRGPLAGWNWHHSKRHQFWMPMGLYERETAAWLCRVIAPGDTVFDVGANAGYFTLLACSRATRSGLVVAFEPTPENAAHIESQLAVNDMTTARVECVAVSDASGTTSFTVETNDANSHLGSVPLAHAQAAPVRSIDVKTVSIDDYVRQTGAKPNVLKVDVEGAELLVLRGAKNTLQELRPHCVISTHSAELRAACTGFLDEIGLRVECLPKFEHELIFSP